MSDGKGFQSRLRLPTWELFLLSSGRGFGATGTPLNGEQRQFAQKIFESSLDVTRIRTKRTKVAAIGDTAAMVWGNTILVNPAVVLTGALFAHELTHVWQYQTTGTRYLTDATLHRSYRVRVVPGRPIGNYEPEQQAVIVENYYLYKYKGGVVTRNFMADNPNITATMKEVTRLMGEIRRRRPMPERMISDDLYRSLTGESTNPAIPPPIDRGDRARPVYQFEFRFK